MRRRKAHLELSVNNRSNSNSESEESPKNSEDTDDAVTITKKKTRGRPKKKKNVVKHVKTPKNDDTNDKSVIYSDSDVEMKVRKEPVTKQTSIKDKSVLIVENSFSKRKTRSKTTRKSKIINKSLTPDKNGSTSDEFVLKTSETSAQLSDVRLTLINTSSELCKSDTSEQNNIVSSDKENNNSDSNLRGKIAPKTPLRREGTFDVSPKKTFSMTATPGSILKLKNINFDAKKRNSRTSLFTPNKTTRNVRFTEIEIKTNAENSLKKIEAIHENTSGTFEISPTKSFLVKSMNTTQTPQKENSSRKARKKWSKATPIGVRANLVDSCINLVTPNKDEESVILVENSDKSLKKRRSKSLDSELNSTTSFIQHENEFSQKSIKKTARTPLFSKLFPSKVHATSPIFMSTPLQQSKKQTKNTPTEKPVTRVKLPNFALIHQKAFEKMEDIEQMHKRKAERAKLLMSGNKPILGKQNNSFKTGKSSKQLKFSPKRIVTTNAVREKPGFTRFGFRLPEKIPDKNVVRDEQKKQITTKSKPVKNVRENLRKELAGVRTNRRFELLMKMREDKKSTLKKPF